MGGKYNYKVAVYTSETSVVVIAIITSILKQIRLVTMAPLLDVLQEVPNCAESEGSKYLAKLAKILHIGMYPNHYNSGS
jgi:hypothetical protein